MSGRLDELIPTAKEIQSRARDVMFKATDSKHAHGRSSVPTTSGEHGSIGSPTS